MQKLIKFIQLVLAIPGLICTITLSVVYLFYLIISVLINLIAREIAWISFKKFINRKLQLKN